VCLCVCVFMCLCVYVSVCLCVRDYSSKSLWIQYLTSGLWEFHQIYGL